MPLSAIHRAQALRKDPESLRRGKLTLHMAKFSHVSSLMLNQRTEEVDITRSVRSVDTEDCALWECTFLSR